MSDVKKAINKQQYYRIEKYKNGEFIRFWVTDKSKEVIEPIIKNNIVDVKIFKCNSKGNNYSGRQIYPINNR